MPGRPSLSWSGVAIGVAVLVAASAANGAVGGRDTSSAVGAGGGTLRIGRNVEFQSLDPALGYGVEEWTRIGYLTCAKLYNYPDAPAPKGLTPIPEVAKDFPTLSGKGRTSTIALRRTFRFSNGERITAANFVAAFNRDASPQLKSPADQYLHEIVGADAVLQGKATEISGVRALGRYTLQIQTTQPLPDLVSRLTMPFLCPVPIGTPPKEQDQLPGSGPFYIASHVPNLQLMLSRNPFYGGTRHPHVQHIVWTIGVGGEASRLAVEQNQLDLSALNGVPVADTSELVHKYGVNRKGGRFFVYPTLGTWRFVFNHRRPAFKGPGQIPLKKAINWALDRHALVAANGSFTGKRTDQILPPALTRAANIYPLGGVNAARLAKASALLAEAKVRPPTLVLYTATLPMWIAWAQIFQYDLKRIGINVDVRYFDNQALRQSAHARRAVGRHVGRIGRGLRRPLWLLRGPGRPPRHPQPESRGLLRPPPLQPPHRGGRSPDRPRPQRSLGGSRRRHDEQRPPLGAVHEHGSPPLRLAEL